MRYASTYRGKIPFELYVQLQNEFPQADSESEERWLARLKHDGTLAQRMFRTPEFRTELIQAVRVRSMAQAGAKRVGHAKAGPSLVPLKAPGAANAKAGFAQRYVDEFMTKTSGGDLQYRYAHEAYELLIEQFDALTPVNGSIFWNGINELALAKLVDRWNGELGGEMFGQLEATTEARYVNKKFEWVPGAFVNYFTETSDRLGKAARGHVTSVVRCGLRFDSIFTVTELPRMLREMEDQLKARKEPTVTDLTIVVIEPKALPNRSVGTFTNNEITAIPIVRPLPGRRINGRDDCTVDGHVDVSIRVREYWAEKERKNGKVRESSAAGRIRSDYDKLIKWP